MSVLNIFASYPQSNQIRLRANTRVISLSSLSARFYSHVKKCPAVDERDYSQRSLNFMPKAPVRPDLPDGFAEHHVFGNPLEYF